MLMKSMQCDADFAKNLLGQLHTQWEEERAQEAAKARIEHLQLSAEKQWIVWQRAKTTRGPVTDDLIGRYSSMADDTSQSLQKREAAMLFSAAEAHLNDAEDFEEGLKAAREALALYIEAGDTIGEADSLRLVIHAHRLKADIARWDYSMGERMAVEAAKEAVSLANTELSRFKERGNVRGEAAMLLSLAEIAMEDRLAGRKAASHSLSLATKALALFKQVGDKKMEARTLLVSARAHCGRHQCREAGQAAKDSVALFHEIGDQRGETNALHMAAAALAQGHEVEDALDYAQEALVMAQEMRSKKLQAFEKTILGSLHLERDRPGEAFAYGKEALDLWEDMDYGKGWASAAEAIMVEALIAKDEEARAVEAAVRGLERSRKTGDRREEVFAQTTLAHAHLANEDFEAAMTAAEASIDICQSLGDQSWEAMSFLSVAQVHVERRDLDAARRAVGSAAAIFQKEEDMHHEAVCTTLMSDILLMKGQVGDALVAAEKGRDMFRTLEEDDQEEVALLLVSQAYATSGEMQNAFDATEDLLELARDTHHRKGEALGLRMLSEWQIATGKLSKALDSAKAMRKICQELRCFRLEAYALHQIGVVHLNKNEPKLASKAAEAARKICQRERHGKGLVHMLLLASEAYTKMMAPPPPSVEDRKADQLAMDAAARALQAGQEALTAANRTGRTGLQAAACFGYARVLFMTGAAKEAEEMAARARLHFAQLRDSWGEARAVLLQAQATHHLDLGSLRSGNLAVEAFQLFRDIGEEQGARAVVEFLSSIGAEGHLRRLTAPAVLPSSAEEKPKQQEAAAPVKPKGLAKDQVRNLVRSMAKTATGPEAGDFNADSPLADIGMDSLTVVSFRNGLAQCLGVKLPLFSVSDSANQVADKIVEQSRGNALSL